MEYNEERKRRYENAEKYLNMVLFEMRQTPDNPADPSAELRIYNGAEDLIKKLHKNQSPETSESALPIPNVLDRFSDEQIDDMITELDKYGRDYDQYEYGLPTYDRHIENMRNIVKVKLNRL